MKDKCYICHETEGILRKTCINTRCTAKTHSFCLEKQYETIKNCGFCKSNIIIKKNFNKNKLINFLISTIFLIIHSYLIFVCISGNDILIFLDIFEKNFIFKPPKDNVLSYFITFILSFLFLLIFIYNYYHPLSLPADIIF